MIFLILRQLIRLNKLRGFLTTTHVVTYDLAGSLMISPTITFFEGPTHQVSVFINVGMLFLNGQDPTQRSSPGYTTYMYKLIWAVRLQQRARPQLDYPPSYKQTNKQTNNQTIKNMY